MLASLMAAPVLILNCGTASLKAALVGDDGRRLLTLAIDAIGAGSRLEIGAERRAVEVADPGAAVALALDELAARGIAAAGLTAVGHRIVHGGERFSGPVLIDDSVEAAIDSLAPLAPLHNPASLAGIRAARADAGE